MNINTDYDFSLLLLPDAPKFTIVAANKTYLQIVNTAEKDLIGKGIFEAFPENPEDLLSKGAGKLDCTQDNQVATEHGLRV